jgi:dipeptidyl aminopeptidase/acylaminoacyl peptidase
VYARLRTGRPYFAAVETGRRRLTRRNRDGLAHDYRVVVPDDDDPARRYPVHVYLHGGVSAPKDTPRWRDPSPYLNDEAVVGDAFEAAGMSVQFVVRPESGHHMRT